MDEVRLGSRTLQPRRQLLVNGRREPIGKRALDILSVLAEARGEIVTKDELLEAVWPGVIVEENALQVHVVALRKALGPEADRLKTIRGVGYQLDIDGEAAPPLAGIATPSPPLDPPPPLAMPSPARTTVWPKVRPYKWALAAVALLLALAASWALLGDNLGLRPQERIPVVVRVLKAEGTRDRTEGALASGITDELVVRLRQIPELRVATADADGNAPGDAFSNAYVVDGSIRRSGDELQVTARLANPSGEVIWSQSFDRTFADLFDVQQRIATQIATALSVSFDAGIGGVAHGGTDNPEAYAAYMQYFVRAADANVTPEPLERAVAIDPKFAKAHLALVFAYSLRIQFSNTEQAKELLAKMDRSSERALAANPRLAVGHLARGWSYLSHKRFGAADREMQRAAALDTGDDPDVRRYLAEYALAVGRTNKALSLARSLAAIDPIFARNPGLVRVLVLAGSYQEAMTLYGRLDLAEENQGVNATIYWQFWAYILSNREADAIAFVRSAGSAAGGLTRWLDAIDNEPGLTTMTLPQLRRWAETRSQRDTVEFALWAAHDGHERLAVDLLRVGLERPGGNQIYKLWHPALAKARKTPQFARLVTDLGLVEAWRESGDWGDFCRPVSATEITCT